MVGPSMTDEDRRSLSLRLQVGFALLVGVSGGLVALQAGGSLVAVLGATVGGLLVGAALTWYLVKIAPW